MVDGEESGARAGHECVMDEVQNANANGVGRRLVRGTGASGTVQRMAKMMVVGQEMPLNPRSLLVLGTSL